MSTVGIIGVVGSLVFGGWQARVLARQLRLQNASAGTEAIQNTVVWLHDVQKEILNHPETWSHFDAPARADVTAARVSLLARMYSDVLNIGLHVVRQIPSSESYMPWRTYCLTMLERSSAIVEEVRANPASYPQLAMLIDAEN